MYSSLKGEVCVCVHKHKVQKPSVLPGMLIKIFRTKMCVGGKNKQDCAFVCVIGKVFFRLISRCCAKSGISQALSKCEWLHRKTD